MKNNLLPESQFENSLLEKGDSVKSRVSVVLNRSLIASTVGRVLGMLPYKDDSPKIPRKEISSFVQNVGEKIPFQKPLLVQVGGTSAFSQMRRFFSLRKDSLGIFSRMILAPRVLVGKFFEKMTRRSNYDPNTHTATIYRPTKACVLHELGHVAAAESSGNSDLYWSDQSRSGILRQEKEANDFALQLANDSDKQKIKPTLDRIYDSYHRVYGRSAGDRPSVFRSPGDSDRFDRAMKRGGPGALLGGAMGVGLFAFGFSPVLIPVSLALGFVAGATGFMKFLVKKGE